MNAQRTGELGVRSGVRSARFAAIRFFPPCI